MESGYYSEREVVFVTEEKSIAQKYCELHMRAKWLAEKEGI